VRGLVRVLAGLVGVSGAVGVLVGAGTAVQVGSDDTLTIGVGRVSTDGPAVTTAPGLLSVFGPTAGRSPRCSTEVAARSPWWP
jgi:hypothetical protein